jgi:hypothetical protein
MARKRIESRLRNYGIYTKWDRKSSDLPQIKEFTHTIPAIENIEFGYIANIRGGRGKLLEFTIEHPPILDSGGKNLPVFEGAEQISSNDYNFYLGDCVWLPVEEKCGTWTMTISCCGEELESMSFEVVPAIEKGED